MIGFSCSSGQQSENKRKQNIKQIPGSCKKTKKKWNIKAIVIPFVVGALGAVSIGEWNF